MLRRTPSLALRASLIFISVYSVVIVAVLALIAAASLADPGQGDHGGAVLALEYAADELREVEGRLQVPEDGRFAKLIAKNPSMWVVVQKEGRISTVGAVPSAAMRTVAQSQRLVGPVQFRLPGDDMPLSVGSLERRGFGSGSVLIAAGGVDPATLSPMDSIYLFLDPVVVGILAFIAVVSMLAMLIAIPFFSRALRPITNEVETIRPQDPGRRLPEDKAPRELLPLVRGFNAALDRLEVELGRRKRFIADMAHELRTPLAVVAIRVESPIDEEAREDIRRGIGRLTLLVAQMLDLERLSLYSQQRSNVDLIATARDVVADLAPMAINQGYDLLLDDPAVPVIVTGDAHAISRAVTNLIGNSIAHGGGGGQIRVVVGADRTIEVVDEGPGVPVDLQSQLFEPFSRGSSSTEGCGLGLHITREIMRRHGGEVWLVPMKRGATFRLTFASPEDERRGKAHPRHHRLEKDS